MENVESLLRPFAPTFAGFDQPDIQKLDLPRALDEYKMFNNRMVSNSVNFGLGYVIFHRVSNYGTTRQTEDRWCFSLDGVTGTLDHIQHYAGKPGWKILDFGNLRLDPHEKGVYSDAVQEHQRIYKHCIQAIGLNLKDEALKTGFARKLNEYESKVTDQEKLIKQQAAELEELRKKMQKGAH